MMNQEELSAFCYDALHLVSLEQGWDLATADMLRTAMLEQETPMIPDSVTSLDIYITLTPSMHAYDCSQNCVHSFESASLDDLELVIQLMKEGM